MYEKTVNEIINVLAKSKNKSNTIEEIISKSLNSLKKNKKIIFCGNGGSASDGSHMVAELVGKFNLERRPLRSISLNDNMPIITSVANDYDYSKVFSRQIEAYGDDNDVLICLSTSGNSLNIVNCVRLAKKKNIKTVAITGLKKNKLDNLVDISLKIDSNKTFQIQEVYKIILHYVCSEIEKRMFLKIK